MDARGSDDDWLRGESHVAPNRLTALCMNQNAVEVFLTEEPLWNRKPACLSGFLALWQVESRLRERRGVTP